MFFKKELEAGILPLLPCWVWPMASLGMCAVFYKKLFQMKTFNLNKVLKTLWRVPPHLQYREDKAHFVFPVPVFKVFTILMGKK